MKNRITGTDMTASVTITLVAGGITFVNEWYQTRNIDWKVPLATALLAVGMEMLSNLSSGAATALSVMVLMGAATTQFNGKSALDTVLALAGSTKTSPSPRSVSKISNQVNPSNG
jgi:hypothetical protein